MKSFLALFLSVLLGSMSPVMAQTVSGAASQSSGSAASSAGLGASPAQSSGPLVPDAIGVATAVKGAVEAKNVSHGSRTLQSGMPIFQKDEIHTGPEGHVQLLLRDETTFTLGADSTITLDEFVYDPQSDTGKVSTQIAKGVFRFVTGKVARKKPENMEVKLPVGSIGIRGTAAGIKSDGEVSKAILLGPGARNNTGNRTAAIEVSNEVNGKTKAVRVNRNGFGTTVGPGQWPTPPAMVPIEEILEFTDSLQVPPKDRQSQNPSAGQGEPTAAEQSGQNLFGVLDELMTTTDVGDLLEQTDENTNQAATNATQAGKVLDGTTSIEDLRRIETGIFHYEGDQGSFTQTAGAACAPNCAGLIDVDVQIDFGNREFGGGGSSVAVCSDSTCNGSFLGDIPLTSLSISAQSFADGTGPASFVASGSGITATFGATNAGGVIAKNGFVDVDFDDGGGNLGNGSATGVRKEGPIN